MELGQEVTDIEIGFGGRAHFKPSANISFTIASIIALGGNEATYHFSQKIKRRIFEESLNPTYAANYIFSFGNQAFYVYYADKNIMGHDLKFFSNSMNLLYGVNFVNLSKIENIGWIDFLNPMLLYSLYSIITNSTFSPWMLSIGEFKFIPSFRLRLAPYGIEKPISIDAKYNDITSKHFLNLVLEEKICDGNIEEYKKYM